MKLINNKKGNIFFGIIVAVAVWFFGILFLPYIYDTQISTLANLSCNLSTISFGNMFTCFIISLANPYFLLTLISLTIGYIVGSVT